MPRCQPVDQSMVPVGTSPLVRCWIPSTAFAVAWSYTPFSITPVAPRRRNVFWARRTYSPVEPMRSAFQPANVWCPGVGEGAAPEADEVAG